MLSRPNAALRLRVDVWGSATQLCATSSVFCTVLVVHGWPHRGESCTEPKVAKRSAKLHIAWCDGGRTFGKGSSKSWITRSEFLWWYHHRSNMKLRCWVVNFRIMFNYGHRIDYPKQIVTQTAILNYGHSRIELSETNCNTNSNVTLLHLAMHQFRVSTCEHAFVVGEKPIAGVLSSPVARRN